MLILTSVNKYLPQRKCYPQKNVNNYVYVYLFRCIAFHPEGHSLFSGAQDSMRVYGWEPVRCYDSFSLAWGKVSDIAISSSQLVSYCTLYLAIENTAKQNAVKVLHIGWYFTILFV